MKELLTQKDLGEMLSMCPETARKLCSTHGIEPVNVGLGETVRLRWMRSRVMEMLTTLEAGGRPQRRASTRMTVTGKSLNQIMRDLAVPVQ